MKTFKWKLKLGILLVGLVAFSSCSNTASVGSSLGINLIYRSIPALTRDIAKYSEQKVSDYLRRSSQAGKANRVTEKKIEKQGGNHKTKPISISVSREARLV